MHARRYIILLCFAGFLASLWMWRRSDLRVDCLSLYRDANHFDESVVDEPVTLYSRHGGLHLDWTSARFVLRHLAGDSDVYVSYFEKSQANAMIEQLALERRNTFGRSTTFSITHPLQKDDPGEDTVLVTQTIPLKVLSAPWWFIAALCVGPPALATARRARRTRAAGARFVPTWTRARVALRALLPRFRTVYLTIAIVFALLWLRSFWGADQLVHRNLAKGTVVRFQSIGGSVCSMRSEDYSNEAYRQQRSPALLDAWTLSIYRADVRTKPAPAAQRLFGQFSADLRFKAANAPAAAIPYWFLLTLMLMPAASQWVFRRRWRAAPPGCCAVCHYDLRGNDGGRCPECGTTIVQAASIPKRPALWRRAAGAGLLICVVLFGVTNFLALACGNQTAYVDLTFGDIDDPRAVTAGFNFGALRASDHWLHHERDAEVWSWQLSHGAGGTVAAMCILSAAAAGGFLLVTGRRKRT